jgi:nicotinamidase-related amidase
MKILIVVDMQKDFIDGALGTKEAVAIVPEVAKRIANSHGELILFTLDTHCENYLSTPEGKKLPVKHCIKGTDGHKINESVINAWRENKNTVVSNELAENSFEKNVFGSTALVDYLKKREKKIREIELIGLCTDICVVSNAIMLKNYLPEVDIIVNEKCCAGVTPQSHKEAINTMKMCQINII